MASGRVGTRQEWAASAGVLERVKEHTRMGDELARQRRELPWVQVEKQYTLRTEDTGWCSHGRYSSAPSTTAAPPFTHAPAWSPTQPNGSPSCAASPSASRPASGTTPGSPAARNSRRSGSWHCRGRRPQ